MIVGLYNFSWPFYPESWRIWIEWIVLSPLSFCLCVSGPVCFFTVAHTEGQGYFTRSYGTIKSDTRWMPRFNSLTVTREHSKINNMAIKIGHFSETRCLSNMEDSMFLTLSDWNWLPCITGCLINLCYSTFVIFPIYCGDYIIYEYVYGQSLERYERVVLRP